MHDALRITDHDHVLGNRDATVTVIEYADFQCPYCARAHATLSDLREQLGDELCLVYRHLPLAHLHPFAEPAAEAAESAAAQDKFWEMHDALFANQVRLNPAALPDLAAGLGLDPERVRGDLAQSRYRQRVQADAQAAHDMGAASTPTFFINGQRHHGDSDRASLTEAIDEARRSGGPA